MPIPSEAAYTELAWTGVETTFAPGIRVNDVSHLKVYSRDAAGVPTLLTSGVHYSITRDATTKVATVVPVALPAAPTTLLFWRVTPATQANDFANLEAYAPQVHTDLADAAVMQIAEARAVLARAALVPMGEAGFTLPRAADRANMVWMTDAAGALIFSTSDGSVWHSGSGAPAAGLGKDTDLYLRTSNGDVYLKTGGAWAVIANIIGPTGPTGSVGTLPDGTVGAPGLAFGSETNSGIRRAGAGDVRHVILGADVLKLTAAGIDVTGTMIVSGAASFTTPLAAAALATDAVETAKIKDANVTFAKLAAAALGTSAEYLAATADRLLVTDDVWAAAAPTAVADGATITLDFSLGVNFDIAAFAGNRTMANPTNVKAGQSGIIRTRQDATGSRVPSWGANWIGPPTLTTTANKYDYLSYYAFSSGIILLAAYKLNVT